MAAVCRTVRHCWGSWAAGSALALSRTLTSSLPSTVNNKQGSQIATKVDKTIDLILNVHTQIKHFQLGN